MIKVLALSVLSLISAPSIADWGAEVPIEFVRVHTSGCVLIKVPNGNFNANGYLVVQPDAVGRKDIYATALAAVTASHNVRIDRSTGGTCYGITDTVSSIQLR